jgi:hypothetical protein
VAVTPTFVANLATLLRALRLTGLKAGSDGEAVLHDAVLGAKVDFHRRLGATRVAYLQAIVYTDTPTSADELLRAAANSLEIKIVRRKCLESMPTMFMDASGDAQETWNVESPFRQGPPSARKLTLLDNEIERDLAYLRTGKHKGSWQCATIEPDETPPRPGDSLLMAEGVIEDEDLDGFADASDDDEDE